MRYRPNTGCSPKRSFIRRTSLPSPIVCAPEAKWYDGQPVTTAFSPARHSRSSVEGDFSQPDLPVIVCEAPPQQVKRHGWTKAEIRIDPLATVWGLLLKG